MELTNLELKILRYVENYSPVVDSIWFEFKEGFEDYSHCTEIVYNLVKSGYLYTDYTPQDTYYKITESGITALHEIGQIEEIETDDTEIAYKDKSGKIYYDIDWQMIQDLGEHLYRNKIEAGGKYKRDNWKKDMNIQDMSDACDRHYLKMKLGWEDEDHALALISNLMILRYLKRQNK